MNFIQKIKDQFSNVHLKLEDIVDANNQMLKSHLNLCKESNEGIIALKSFGEQESPGLKQAFINLSDALKSIEVSRTAMVVMLESSFVVPIKELATLQRNVYKAESLARKAYLIHEKHTAKLKIQKERTKKGLDANGLEKLASSIKKAEEAFANSETLLETRKKEEKEMKIEFEKLKLQNMKRTISLLVQEYKKLHSIGISALTDTNEFIEKIHIQQESTSAILYPIPHLQAPDYLAGIKALRKRISEVGTRLYNVRISNLQLLKAHTTLQEETRKVINLFITYAQEETPGIQKAIENFAEGLETIESNREAFEKQMQFEFIHPITEILKEKQLLVEQIEKTLQAYKEHKKWEGTLEHIRLKDAHHLKPGEIEQAKENEASFAKLTRHEQNILTQNTHLFTLSKIKSFKNCLTSILERNFSFHDQAYNIIANSELLAKDINLKSEFKSIDIKIDLSNDESLVGKNNETSVTTSAESGDENEISSPAPKKASSKKTTKKL